MAFDLSRRQTPRIQTDDRLVETVKAALSLGHNLWLKTSVAVPGRLERQVPKLSLERLGGGAVAGVAAVITGRIVFVVAQMHRQLCTHRLLQQTLLQLLEQSVSAQ